MFEVSKPELPPWLEWNDPLEFTRLPLALVTAWLLAVRIDGPIQVRSGGRLVAVVRAKRLPGLPRASDWTPKYVKAQE